MIRLWRRSGEDLTEPGFQAPQSVFQRDVKHRPGFDSEGTEGG